MLKAVLSNNNRFKRKCDEIVFRRRVLFFSFTAVCFNQTDTFLSILSFQKPEKTERNSFHDLHSISFSFQHPVCYPEKSDFNYRLQLSHFGSFHRIDTEKKTPNHMPSTEPWNQNTNAVPLKPDKMEHDTKEKGLFSTPCENTVSYLHPTQFQNQSPQKKGVDN